MWKHLVNVKMQSDKASTTQIYFFFTKQQLESFLNETRLQVDNENEQWGEIQKLIKVF